ncbi:MAG TPA: hypothetical protein VNY52_11630, partial [Solirubrobacteraceae bacterium]|nr:hypothetical protein [Solirubrobacteraceae bacterium]
MRAYNIRRVARRAALLPLCLTALLALAGSAAAKPSGKPFELVPGSFKVIPSTLQAGAHEDLTTSFDFAHNGLQQTYNDARRVVVNLPAGFTGNNTAVPICPVAKFDTPEPEGRGVTQCPPASQIGTISFTISFAGAVERATVPLYNLEVTSPGITVEFGYNFEGILAVPLMVTVRPGDTGLTVTSPDTEYIGEPHEITVTVWGVPGAPEHDAQRGQECATSIAGGCRNGGKPADGTPKPYLANPTSCTGEPLLAKMEADSWEVPETWSSAVSEIAPLGECERVPFSPSIVVQPTTDTVESPSGLGVSLLVPQTWEAPEAVASSDVKDARVVLPEGYTVNPSAGSGLAACTPRQYEAETFSSPPGAGCPPESKLGTVTIATPVLAEPIEGSVYLAKPYENPFDSLLALYVVAKAPDRGIVVKTAGRIEADPVTGQLTSTFENLPQQPFGRVTLKFTQSTTSPLVSPPTCGRYTAQAELTPYSAPTAPRALSNSLEIEKGIAGGPCPAGGVPPFKPTVVSGSIDNAAGEYSPFYLRIAREDGEQEITRFTTVLPPGLTGNLSGIPFCSDAQIEAARRASGAQELSEPACPAASEIGHTLVGAGVGSVLAWTPGKVYLAGPYHGSALSIVSVTSATVGPFDLGTVVIRFALRINPVTGQVEIDANGSDPIPHIIDGIVVHVRDIHVYIDRSKFTLNPTSCRPMSIADTITGAGADPANPADQAPVGVTAPYQAADCQNLQFKPLFKVSTSGRTSRSNGASLSVKLTYPNAPQGTEANIHSVKVELPKRLPSRLTTLQKACRDTVFDANPANCPAASVVGHATALTPVLPVPLSGPAYFVS